MCFPENNWLTILSSPAGSVLTKSITPMLSPEPLIHTEAMSSGNVVQSPNPATVLSTSDAVPPAAVQDASPMEDVQKSFPAADNLSDQEIDEDSDEDAEGEPDEDFDASMQIQQDDDDSNDEIDSHSTRPGKRKQAHEEEDFMMKDPELYGLRRSVRTIISTQSFVLR